MAPTADKATKREYGSGSITWLTPRKARLRVRVKGEKGQRSKVVMVSHQAHGGRGEAQAELEKFAREVELELVTDGQVVRTVGEMFTAYVSHCERVGRRPGTIEAYEKIGQRLTVDLKATPLPLLTSHQLDVYYGKLGETFQANSVRQSHAVLSAALNQAVKWGWIATSPAKGATPPSRHRPKRTPLDMADVQRMVEKASRPKSEGGKEDVVLAMTVVMAALTGARRGELAALRWDDIDPVGCSIRVERQWVTADTGSQYLGPPKSGEDGRTVPLGAVGIALIERYRMLLRDLLHREPAGWLLSNDAGVTPIRAKTLGTWISELASSLNIDATTHTFRRMSATQLIAAGVDVDTSARRLGHTPEVMMESYVLGADDRAIAAGGSLEARFISGGLLLGELLPVTEQGG